MKSACEDRVTNVIGGMQPGSNASKVGKNNSIENERT